MDPVVVLVFAVVYLAMVLGRLPGLTLDRTGVALLGAIALVAARRIRPRGWGSRSGGGSTRGSGCR